MSPFMTIALTRAIDADRRRESRQSLHRFRRSA